MARLAVPLVLVASLFSCPAVAQVPGDEHVWDGGYQVKNERRADFALGIELGYAMGEAHGVMNEVEELNDDSFEHSTGFAVGNDLGIWFGGALRDWFTVGIGAVLGGSTGNDILVARQSFQLRLDLYPAYSLGGAWRDFGVRIDGGLGLLAGVDKDDNDEILFEGGSVSSLGAGAFWEGVRFGKGRHFGFGPMLGYRILRGIPSTAHTVTLGTRLTYYSGPRRKKARPHAATAWMPAEPAGRW